MAHGRSNIAPMKIPWDLIRSLVTETYGGKIDDEGDFEELRKIVDSFLRPEAYDDEHVLIKGHRSMGSDSSKGDGDLTVPGGTGMKGFMEWVDQLPEREPPTYLGLPPNAEKLLLVGEGKNMIRNLAKITEILDEGEQLVAEIEKPS